jgi:regulator of protease activity HflC (stomatin/prohibitin superfamily)
MASYEDLIAARDEESRMRAQGERNKLNKQIKLIVGAIIAFIAIIFVIIIYNKSTDHIAPGYKGVIFSATSGVSETAIAMGPGFHGHWPWQDILQYPESKETVYLVAPPTGPDGKPGKGEDNSFKVNTADGKSVDADVTYAYRMDTTRLGYIVNRFRKADASTIAETFIKQQLKSAVQAITTQYSVLEVYGGEKRNEITKKVQELFTSRLAPDGIIVEDLTFQDIRPDGPTLQSIQKIVDSKNQEELLKQQSKNAEQEALNNKITAEGAAKVSNVQFQRDADQQIIAAKAAAESLKISSQASADALAISSKAKADANARVAASLSEPILKQQLIEAMPSIKFPTFWQSGGAGGGNLFQIPQSMLDSVK